jgi:2,3-bisphosphoglycerate-dependent phosphoglycerate mutase
MKKSTILFYLLIFIISFPFFQCAQQEAQITTIFLVRHAEKVTDGGDDPSLTPEGFQRAEELAYVLKNVKLDAIYDTPYKRTKLTVKPIADLLGREIQTIPSLKKEDLTKFIDEAIVKHKGEKIIIASHSNIVPALIKLIRQEEYEMRTMKSLEDSAYDDLFMVVFTERKNAQVFNLKYGKQTPGK